MMNNRAAFGIGWGAFFTACFLNSGPTYRIGAIAILGTCPCKLPKTHYLHPEYPSGRQFDPSSLPSTETLCPHLLHRQNQEGNSGVNEEDRRAELPQNPQ